MGIRTRHSIKVVRASTDKSVPQTSVPVLVMKPRTLPELDLRFRSGLFVKDVAALEMSSEMLTAYGRTQTGRSEQVQQYLQRTLFPNRRAVLKFFAGLGRLYEHNLDTKAPAEESSGTPRVRMSIAESDSKGEQLLFGIGATGKCNVPGAKAVEGYCIGIFSTTAGKYRDNFSSRRIKMNFFEDGAFEVSGWENLTKTGLKLLVHAMKNLQELL